MAARAFETVIFDAEGDTALVETDQTTVGYCYPVRIARQICQHGLWSGEGLLGVDDPINLVQRFEEFVEGITVNEFCMFAEEVQFPRIMQLGQAFQNEPPVKARQHMHGQEEVLAAGDPFCAVRRQTTARHDHMDMRVVRYC